MNILNHLAIIMDGNSRWAKANNCLLFEGHKAGAKAAWDIIQYAISLKIKNLSLFAFSSENWGRPHQEVTDLFRLLEYALDNDLEKIKQLGVSLKFIGDIQELPFTLHKKILEAMEYTEDNKALNLYFAFNYGSRSEIVRAAKKLLKRNFNPDLVSEELFSEFFYSPKMPDVDLMIRTSGEKRISNFLLWQAAYAELYFEDKLWPDFTEEDLDKAIREFNLRKRNFGGRN